MKTILTLVVFFFLQGESKLTIEKQWVRVSAEGTNTAFFFDIVNQTNKADTLYDVKSEVAEITEIHESYKIDGKMGMRKIQHIVIPANSTFNLKPRSYHIMLIGLIKDINANEEVELTLFFKQAGEVKIKGFARTM